MKRPARSIDQIAAGYAGGHRVDVLLNGRETYPAMLRAIDGAERTCCLETYILKDDRTGRAFARALVERARAGVEVALIYDAVGSLGLPEAYTGYLAEAGVRVASYHASPWRFWEWNQRDHRKILVVDGRVGFLGGLNIADEYAPRESGGGGWRDTHVRVEGPAVDVLGELFRRDHRRAAFLGAAPPPRRDEPVGDPPHCAATGPRPASAPRAGARIEVLGTVRHGERSRLKKAYIDAIGAARRRVLVTSAYFVPDRAIRKALRAAARRGVDVRVITAGLSDVTAVQLASRHLYPGLLRGGVRIYERLERVLHAKTAVIDGRWCAIGSYNLNRRSIFHDLEVLACILCEEAGARLERAFDDDLEESIEIDLVACRARPLAERALGFLALGMGHFL